MFLSKIKKSVIILSFFLFLFSNQIFSQVDTTINGLRGYEDLNGNTQLFYRLISRYNVNLPNDENKGISRKDIFHFDVKSNTDSLFISHFINYHTPLPSFGQTVSDFEFVDNTLIDFYQCGDGVTSFEPSPVVVFNRDYNNSFGVDSFHGMTDNMVITKYGNGYNVYVSTNDGIYSSSRGFSLFNASDGLALVSVDENNPNVFFATNRDNKLYKSTDTAKTFFLVDSINTQESFNDSHENLINRRFIYDSDGTHIYRIVKNEKKYKLLVSDNKGEQNSWFVKLESGREMFLSFDSTQSGVIYVAYGKSIFESSNYGDSFQLFKELEKNIIGIYKKPNSDLIYATTKYSLLEITSTSVKVLKHLINYDALNFYPLHVGDIRQYLLEQKGTKDTTFYFTTEIVRKDTVDGVVYFFMIGKNLNDVNGMKLRIDSTDATVWSETCMLDSLSMTVDDKFSNECYGTITCIEDSNETILDEKLRTKSFNYTPAMTLAMDREYKYAYGIGLVNSTTSFPSGDINISLVYAKIDSEEFGKYIPESVNPDVAFYPLHVGDTRQYLVEYKYTDATKDSSYYASVYVRGIDTLADGKQYFRITNSENYCLKYIRVDSTDATVWDASTMLDSLSMQVNDEMSLANSQNPKMCFADSIETLFDKSVRVKTFAPINIPLSQSSANGMGVKEVYKYAWGLGEIYSETSDIGIEANRIVRTLNYAKIDGVEYGNLNHPEDENIFLSESTLYLFQNENNNNFADTTWLVNMSSKKIQVDSVINEHMYSYGLDIFYNDQSSHFFRFSHNDMDSVVFSVNSHDSVKIVLSDPDLCPICGGGESTEFTDSLHFYTSSKENPVLLLSIIGDGTIDVENIESGNLKFSLQQNYPNPFNPSTTIKYSIPNVETLRATSVNVTLKVYDMLGQEVATLVNKEQKTGNYEIIFNANKLTSGIYFYKLQSGNFVATKKLMLLK